MRPIAPKLRQAMSLDPFMARCCLTHQTRLQTKIEWHHNLIFGGRQVNEAWAILPLAESLHRAANQPKIKEQLDWIMLNRATDDELRRYSKVVDLIKKRDKLNKKYGEYKNQKKRR